jgi:cell division protein ZapA
MREIRDSGKVVGMDRIAVMAALNVCNDMLQGRNTSLKADERMLGRIRILNDALAGALGAHH